MHVCTSPKRVSDTAAPDKHIFWITHSNVEQMKTLAKTLRKRAQEDLKLVGQKTPPMRSWKVSTPLSSPSSGQQEALRTRPTLRRCLAQAGKARLLSSDIPDLCCPLKTRKSQKYVRELRISYQHTDIRLTVVRRIRHATTILASW